MKHLQQKATSIAHCALRLPRSDSNNFLLVRQTHSDKSVQIFESLNCILYVFFQVLLFYYIYYLFSLFSLFSLLPFWWLSECFDFTFDIFVLVSPPMPVARSLQPSVSVSVSGTNSTFAMSAMCDVEMCSSTDRHEIFINLLFIAFDSMFVMFQQRLLLATRQVAVASCQLQLQFSRFADLQLVGIFTFAYF